MTATGPFDEGERGDWYRPPAPIPALARFLFASLWAAGVFWASGYVYALFPGHNLIPDLISRVLACALTAGGFAFFLRVLDYNEAPLTAALGLPLDATGARQFGAGLALGGLMITADVAAIAWFGSVRLHFHWNWHVAILASGEVTLLVFGALLEELSFRGYPFEKLVESVGPVGAVMVLSGLFGAVHLHNPDAGGWLSWGFFNTLAVGVLFALARLRSGSLWLSFGMHFGWNLFEGTVFGLPVSGLDEFATLVRGHAHGSRLLTGGGYGPEASATCAVVLVAAIPLLLGVTAARNLKHRQASAPTVTRP